MITSLTNKRVKELAKLHTKKHRIIAGQFLVEGFHLVEEAKKANLLKEVLSTTDYGFENTTLVMEHVLEKLASTKSPQGIIGVVEFPNLTIESNKVLVLDVSNPINLGTLLRSALGFGFKKVILTENSCDEFSDKVLRGSQGAIFHLDIERMSFNDVLAKYSDYEILAADMGGETEIEAPVKVVLILGNESLGLPEEIKENTKLISIQTETIESLNLSVAGSILMHQLKG